MLNIIQKSQYIIACKKKNKKAKTKKSMSHPHIIQVHYVLFSLDTGQNVIIVFRSIVEMYFPYETVFW